MLNQQTIEKLTAMKLTAMANHYRYQLETPTINALTFEERFAILIDSEYMSRHNNRIKKLLHAACLRIPSACIEDLNYSPIRKLDRSYVARLLDCNWIMEHRNMIITGSAGAGKTYLACAFGNNVCHYGYRVKYYRVNRLLIDLSVSRGDGSYNRLLKTLKKVDLLILDDWGLTILDPLSSRDLLEVIEDRFNGRSTIISAQLPVKNWHAIFEDSTIADAVLDRLVHNSHRFELEGPSLRGNTNDNLVKIETSVATN